MFRKQHGEWYWGTESLGLTKLEAALLEAMLRTPGVPRRAHVWIAWELGLPCSPVTGKACVFTLRRKLDSAGDPTETLLGDASCGVMLAALPSFRQTWPSRSAYPSPPRSFGSIQPLPTPVLQSV